MDINLSTLYYSSIIPTLASSTGRGIVVDSNKIAYVVGEVEALDFPTTPDGYGTEHDPTKNPYDQRVWDDAFIIKVDTFKSGYDALVYGSFLGGSNEDHALGVDIGPGDHAYIAG